MTEIVALVPMRHHSERVPGKNYRLLAGKPLYEHILTTLLACPQISTIAVDTDSPLITGDLAERYPQLKVIERPAHLCADDVPMNQILLHDISLVPADFYLQTHSTNPLLTPATINQAIERFLDSYPAHDSLFSVTRWQTRLWDTRGSPLNHNPSVLLRTQDLPPVYEENSCLYLFTGENLARRQNRIGERPMLFEMDPAEAWDIDDELDFEIVDYLMRRRSTDDRRK